MINACDSSFIHSRDVTFKCGRAGVCALGAVVTKYSGDDTSLNHHLTQFKKIKLSKDHPDELLYGRAGYLWACLFLNKHLGKETIPSSSMDLVVREIIENGRKLGERRVGGWVGGGGPYVYEWYGERYWGAVHGLAGIMNVLMECELTSDEREDVKATLRYMIHNRYPSGNYPPNEEDKKRDMLVHWCHGAPGLPSRLSKPLRCLEIKSFYELPWMQLR